MTRILVLGGGGMLGHKLCQLLPAHGFAVTATLRSAKNLQSLYPGVYDAVDLVTNLDVLDQGALERVLDRAGPDVVVNCVGIVKQLAAAEDRYLSVAINALLPHQLARWCAAADRRLIHISTDCVFDGSRGRYLEEDASDARDLYGKSKFLGETSDIETAAITLRTSIIGRELGETSHGLLEWFLAQQGSKVKGFARAIYSGLTTHELAKVIALLSRNNVALHGVYHVAGPSISKYELLQLIKRVYDLDIEISRDVEFCCDRSLIADRFSAATGYSPPGWEQMIGAMHADPTPYEEWKRAARELTERWLSHAFRSC